MTAAGECYSYLPAAADGNGRTTPASDADPTTSATATANGKLWWCVFSSQTDGNVWYR